jgi:DNA-binding NarL/FixJ family response regulator
VNVGATRVMMVYGPAAFDGMFGVGASAGPSDGGDSPGGQSWEIVLPRDENEVATPVGARIEILLVEDDLRFAKLVERILAEEAPEFQIVHASRVSAALARLVRQPIRLVLSDLNLPDGAGAGTVRHLTRAAPNVPLIVLSGSPDLEVALECVREGAEEFVQKNALDAETLVRLIRLTLERRHRMADQWAAGYDDPITGVQGPAALEAVGRQLLKVSDRTGLSIGVLTLRAEGRSALLPGEGPRIAELAEILRRTLRRCDVIARVEPNELAVVLVGDRLGPYAAGSRIGDALAPLSGGAQLRMGEAIYDRHHRQTIQELLAQARNALRPVGA